MPDFRSLISRMADELDYYRQLLMDDRREVHALATEARAALAQPEPADGEVAELVQAVRDAALNDEWGNYRTLIRAADLLERLSPPQPVPVSERLPGPGDWVWHCYAGVRFWQHGIYNGCQFFVGDGPESQPATHWLPAHALPLPQPH